MPKSSSSLRYCRLAPCTPRSECASKLFSGSVLSTISRRSIWWNNVRLVADRGVPMKFLLVDDEWQARDASLYTIRSIDADAKILETSTLAETFAELEANPDV